MTRLPHPFHVFGACLLLCGFTAGNVLGQTGDTIEVPALVEEAKSAHDANQFARCASLFRQAYELTRAPELLLNAAVCQFDGTEDLNARDSLREMLELAPAASPELRQEASALLQAVERELAAAGHSGGVLRNAPEESERAEPLPSAPAEAVKATQEAPSLVPSYLLGGASIITFGVSTAFGLAALRNWENAKSACPELDHCPDDRGSRLSSRASTQGNVATVGFALSAAAGVGALVLWLQNRSDDASNVATISVDSNGLLLRIGGTL